MPERHRLRHRDQSNWNGYLSPVKTLYLGTGRAWPHHRGIRACVAYPCVKDRDHPLTEMIAKQIIKIAQAGGHDAAQLSALAVAELRIR